MTRNRPFTLAAGAATAALIALAAIGCGGGSGSATVGIASSGLGEILVDSEGHTLYLFKKDSDAESACAGTCANAWPPLRANGEPTLDGAANPSLVATIRRPDGAPQVTYNGHPLYRYQGDQRPGNTAGQGSTAYGAAWYALSPAGNQVSSNGGASSYSGASGY
jgi:predicted lipoprotein with Yx(FWY)xxD motif